MLTKRQNEIVDAALELTAQGGIQNLTVKRLAEVLGISEPAIYRHFRNKAEILSALIDRFDTAVVPDAEQPGVAGIMAFARGRFAQVAATPSLARVMFAEELFMDDPELSSRLLELMHRHKDALARCFDEGRSRGEIRRELTDDVLFRLVFGPVRLLVKQWGATRGAFDLQREGENLLAALQVMLRPAEQKENDDETQNH